MLDRLGYEFQHLDFSELLLLTLPLDSVSYYSIKLSRRLSDDAGDNSRRLGIHVCQFRGGELHW